MAILNELKAEYQKAATENISESTELAKKAFPSIISKIKSDVQNGQRYSLFDLNRFPSTIAEEILFNMLRAEGLTVDVGDYGFEVSGWAKN